jgi:uncharacterized membrane protein YuzA (DUF378 family)
MPDSSDKNPIGVLTKVCAVVAAFTGGVVGLTEFFKLPQGIIASAIIFAVFVVTLYVARSRAPWFIRGPMWVICVVFGLATLICVYAIITEWPGESRHSSESTVSK